MFMRSRSTVRIKLALLAALSQISTAAANDWPQWRGPNRDGVVSADLLPSVWPDSLLLHWRVEIGKGKSSPIVSGDRIFIHTRRDNSEEISSLRVADGKLIWRQENAAAFTKNQYALSQGEGPFSTPIFHNGRLYTLGINGLLSCFDAETGDVIWRRSFSEQVSTSKLFCGTSMSPIITDGLCIVHVGDDIEGALIAYDVVTGDPKWRWSKQGPGYASPILAEIAGAHQLITLTDEACVAVDPGNGTLLWQFPFIDEWNENIVTPIFHRGLLILAGVRKGTLALRLSKKNDTWKAEKVWDNTELPMYMSSPVIQNDVLFGLTKNRKGQFFALDPVTGETLWTSEGRQGQNAVLLAAGKQLCLLTTEGRLVIARGTANGFDHIREYSVSNTATWAHPVLLEQGILIKDEASLALWTFD